MQAQVAKANDPKIVLDDDGLPVILSSTTAEEQLAPSTEKSQTQDTNDTTQTLLEDDADREKRELAISAKLWSKARRAGPPRKTDMNPMIIKSGRYITQEECHAACKWFVEQGETSKGAWLHKYPKWTKWGHETGRDKREVVERDQMVMRILRNYSAEGGPTDEQRDEALTLYQRLQSERNEERAKSRKKLMSSSNTSRQVSEHASGLIASATMAGVDVPLGWDEENATHGAQEDIEADVQKVHDIGKNDEETTPKPKRKKKKE